MLDNRLTLQNSLPLTSSPLSKGGVPGSSSLSTIGQNISPYGGKLPVQMPLQRLSLIEPQIHHLQSLDSPTESPTTNKRFRFSSLRRNRHSLSSTDNTSPT